MPAASRRPPDHPELTFFREWLDRGYAGEMAYLQRSADRRADVRACAALGAHGHRHRHRLQHRPAVLDRDRRSRARADRALRVGRRLPRRDRRAARRAAGVDARSQSPEPFEARAYVDTGPVQERVYAQHAGIGWIGKNTCVINPELGSWIFLAEIICSLPLDVDAPALDQCGTCTLCLEACPTQRARRARRARLDPCISYLTIEHRGDIRRSVAAGDRLARLRLRHLPGSLSVERGRAARPDDPAWQPRPAWDRVDLLSLAERIGRRAGRRAARQRDAPEQRYKACDATSRSR